MAPYLLFFFISIAALAWGTYSDLKERLVSNWLTYGLVAVGLIGHGILAFLEKDPIIFITSLGVTVATFVIAYGLYKAGVWAGGDVKLFTGLAALNPVNPNLLTSLGLINIPIFASITLPVFPVSLFVFSLFAMLPYGAILAGARLLKNKVEKKKFKEQFSKRVLHSAEVSATIVGLNAAVLMMGVSQWLVIPGLFILAFLPKKAKALVSILLMAFALWQGWEAALIQFAGLFGLFVWLYLLLKLYTLSKILMRKPIKISKLEEGMISAQTIVKTGKTVKIVKELAIKKLIKYFASNRVGKAMELIQPKGEVVVSSHSAGGLTKKEIKELKALAAKKKIPDSLMVKESAPFVPAVLIAYIALNIVGDVIWFWFSII